METLRSTFVQHVDTEPMSLETFAEGTGRTGELVATDGYPERPTLDLFLDHARWIVDRQDLDACHVRSRVTDVSAVGDCLHVETTGKPLDSRRVVLALGLGGPPTRPAWADHLPEDSPVDHVWGNGVDPSTAAKFDGETYVVGGGITAAQLACRLAKTTDVTLLSRHELTVELSEADPYWLNWDHVEREIHELPPGSDARHERIRAARNDGTIPPYVKRRLTAARNRGDVGLRIGEIACARATEDGLVLEFVDGSTTANAQVMLATGLDPIPNHPLVGTVAQSLSLERGTNGFPVLDDRTLAWKRTDGTGSRVFVSGALAETTVGPFARNVIGARRVAERLLASRSMADSVSAPSALRGRS
jgi:hypothetical protein